MDEQFENELQDLTEEVIGTMEAGITPVRLRAERRLLDHCIDWFISDKQRLALGFRPR
jgi:hypothetical protein